MRLPNSQSFARGARLADHRRGWLGIGLAVGGLWLPWLAFCVLFNHMERVLISPDMDDWEVGPGAMGFLICQIVITGLELAALGFAARARQTWPGRFVFLLAPLVVWTAWIVLGDWYRVVCRFT